MNTPRLRTVAAAGTLLLVLVGALGCASRSHPGAERDAAGRSSSSPSTKPGDSTFDPRSKSLTDPNSPWVIVNKQHPLVPRDFAPSDLRTPRVSLRDPGAPEMQLRRLPASAIERLFAAALKDGVKLQISTAYR